MGRSSWSRRGIIVGSASLLLLPAPRSSAQSMRRRPKVGLLLLTAPDDVDTPADRVRMGLAELGYFDGQTVSLEVRFAHHTLERLPALAAELAAAQPDVIHTWTTTATRALAAATSTIPIVAAPLGEPRCRTHIAAPGAHGLRTPVKLANSPHARALHSRSRRLSCR